MSALLLPLLVLYIAATAARIVISVAQLREPPALPGRAEDVTILQPILSGDPALETCLTTNLIVSPSARFIWLVDEDDAAAREIAARHAEAPHLRIITGPPPKAGENPKVAKLAAALPLIETPLFAVLDDDTMLPPGGAAAAAGALARGDLVTGLPCYETARGAWSGLLAAFVNGAALITYPCAARLAQQCTINGMFYLGRTADLRALGGFDAIRTQLTDDYAMASLYLAAGKRIVQTNIVHPIRTTVRDADHYVSIMRRWMIFALRYLRENRSPFTLGLIGIPTFLPPLMLVAALFTSAIATLAALLALAGKAACMAILRERFAAQPSNPIGIAYEVAADLLTPLHLLNALANPNTFHWRSRAMRMEGERIHYD